MEGFRDGLENIHEDPPDLLGDGQFNGCLRHIAEHVLKNHKVTNGEVQKMLGVSKPTATRLLQKLEIVLEQVGHGAGAYYRIRNY